MLIECMWKVREKREREESIQNDLQTFGLSIHGDGDTITWDSEDSTRNSITGKSEHFCLVMLSLRLPSLFSSE